MSVFSVGERAKLGILILLTTSLKTDETMHAIRSQLVVICLLAGLGAAQPAWAQSQPERGLDRSAVEARFGAPQRIEGPVGEPPITKWVYTDFIVVFEYDH